MRKPVANNPAADPERIEAAIQDAHMLLTFDAGFHGLAGSWRNKTDPNASICRAAFNYLAELDSTQLPDHIRGFLYRLLNEYKGKATYRHRNDAIADAVLLIAVAYGLKPTRRSNRWQSACSVVVKALERRKEKMAEASVRDIWHERTDFRKALHQKWGDPERARQQIELTRRLYSSLERWRRAAETNIQ
jgi:hypothetical protein